MLYVRSQWLVLWTFRTVQVQLAIQKNDPMLRENSIWTNLTHSSSTVCITVKAVNALEITLVYSISLGNTPI